MSKKDYEEIELGECDNQIEQPNNIIKKIVMALVVCAAIFFVIFLFACIIYGYIKGYNK